MHPFPTLRSDLQVVPFSDDQGALFFDVFAPAAPKALRLYDVEWILAEKLSSSQNPEAVRTLAKQLFDYVPDDKELLVLMETLARFGLCETPSEKGATTAVIPPVRAAVTPPTAVSMPAVAVASTLHPSRLISEDPPVSPSKMLAPRTLLETNPLPATGAVLTKPTPEPVTTPLQEANAADGVVPSIANEEVAIPTIQPTTVPAVDSTAPVQPAEPISVTASQPVLAAEQPELRSRSWIPIFVLLVVFVGIAYVVYLLLSPTPTP